MLNQNKKIFISTLLITSIFLLVLTKFTGFVVEKDNPYKIKIATFAVCEGQDEYTHCEDKIFASCNKSLTEINDNSVYCDGIKYNISNITLGEAYLKNWTDPREKDLINGWATSD